MVGLPRSESFVDVDALFNTRGMQFRVGVIVRVESMLAQ